MIGGVSNDTRTIKAGDLYIAIKGARFDGHAFIADALAKGACGALVSEVVSGLTAPMLVVPDTHKALMQVAQKYRRKIGLRIIAVTGSAGKSTVKEMTAQVLAGGFRTAATRGNWNNDIGLPLSLLAMSENTELGVFEIGMNHPGEISALCRVLEPDWGVVTNVGPVHIEFFDSVEAIAEEKANLFRALPQDGIAVIEHDGKFRDILRKAAGTRKIISVSMADRQADYYVVRRNADGLCEICERLSGETSAIILGQPGDFSICNALMAVAVARSMGLGWDQIRGALEVFRPMPMRWQVSECAGVRLINDSYNANPLSMSAAITTFSGMQGVGRKIMVLAGMLELGVNANEEHRKIGSLSAGSGIDFLVTVGELGRVIAGAAVDAGMDASRVITCGSNGDALGELSGLAKPGDTILFKGSRGMKLEQIISGFEQLFVGQAG